MSFDNEKKYKYLIKNIGFLTIGSFSTKILSFLLLPLYTSVLSTTDYGSFDMVSTTVSLLIPILTLNISDGTLRYSLDSVSSRKDVFSVSIHHYIVAIFGLASLVGINIMFGIMKTIIPYSGFLFLLFTVIAFHRILTSFARGLDKVKEVSVAGVLGSLVMIVLNVVFLLYYQLGLKGYFWANIIGVLVQCVFLIAVLRAWRFVDLYNKDSYDVKKRMRGYSLPLVANNLAWWVNNVSDRYIVTLICGIAVNGIYSVAYKIPSILSILQSIFQQAWTLSAVKDYESEDRNAYFTKVYNMMNFILVISCSVLIVLDKPLAGFLYSNEFYSAWKYVPFFTGSYDFLVVWQTI